MASLLRVSRGFARAACQVASPVAPLGSGGAAPLDLPRSRRLSFLRGGYAVDAQPVGRASAMSFHTDDPSPLVPDVSGITEEGTVDFVGDDKDLLGTVDFVVDDKDLESDEALWALYERWCKHFNEERDHEEMVGRFPEFKESALRMDCVNKANLPYKLGINKFADGKLRKLCFYGLADNDFLKSQMSSKRDCPVDMLFSEPRIYFKRGYMPYFKEDSCPEGTDEIQDGHSKGTGDESNLA